MSWENVGSMFRFHYGLSCKFVQYYFIFVEKRILHLSCVCVSICHWLDYMNRSPVSENSKLMSFGSNHRYIECIKSAYDFASSELLNLIKEKVRLSRHKCFSCAYIFFVLFGSYMIRFMLHDLHSNSFTSLANLPFFFFFFFLCVVWSDGKATIYKALSSSWSGIFLYDQWTWK